MQVIGSPKLFCGSYCELHRMKYCGGIIRQMYSDRHQSLEYWTDDSDGGRSRCLTVSDAMKCLREERDD